MFHASCHIPFIDYKSRVLRLTSFHKAGRLLIQNNTLCRQNGRSRSNSPPPTDPHPSPPRPENRPSVPEADSPAGTSYLKNHSYQSSAAHSTKQSCISPMPRQRTNANRAPQNTLNFHQTHSLHAPCKIDSSTSLTPQTATRHQSGGPNLGGQSQIRYGAGAELSRPIFSSGLQQSIRFKRSKSPRPIR